MDTHSYPKSLSNCSKEYLDLIAKTPICNKEMATQEFYTDRIINKRGTDDEFYLPPQTGVNRGKKTLILDLDETLVHSLIRKRLN